MPSNECMCCTIAIRLLQICTTFHCYVAIFCFVVVFVVVVIVVVVVVVFLESSSEKETDLKYCGLIHFTS